MSFSPDARPGSQRSCCSGRARDLDRDGAEGLDREDQPGRRAVRGSAARSRGRASAGRHRGRRGAPRTGSRRRRARARRRRMSSGQAASRSIAAARGATCSSARTRTASRRRICSSLRRTEPWVGRVRGHDWHRTSAAVPRRSWMTSDGAAAYAWPSRSGRPAAGVSGTRPAEGSRHGPDATCSSSPSPSSWRWAPAVGDPHAARSRAPTTPDGSDSPFAVSTEGMKICPKCGMGNLWTERALQRAAATAELPRLNGAYSTASSERPSGHVPAGKQRRRRSAAASSSLMSCGRHRAPGVGTVAGLVQAVAQHDHAERARRGHRARAGVEDLERASRVDRACRGSPPSTCGRHRRRSRTSAARGSPSRAARRPGIAPSTSRGAAMTPL